MNYIFAQTCIPIDTCSGITSGLRIQKATCYTGK